MINRKPLKRRRSPTPKGHRSEHISFGILYPTPSPIKRRSSRNLRFSDPWKPKAISPYFHHRTPDALASRALSSFCLPTRNPRPSRHLERARNPSPVPLPSPPPPRCSPSLPPSLERSGFCCRAWTTPTSIRSIASSARFEKLRSF